MSPTPWRTSVPILAASLLIWSIPGLSETPAEPEKHRILRNTFPIHVVPTMANSPGRFGAFFKTRVVVYNPTGFQYTIHATLYGPKGKVETRTIEMEPDTFWLWDNFLEQAFGYRGAGAVEFDAWFDPPGGSSDFEFSVQAEVYTDSPNGRYTTLVVDGEGAEDIRMGTSALDDGHYALNAGVASNADQRVNVGIFNDGFSEETFVAVVVDDGEIVETVLLTVPAKSWAQKSVNAKFDLGSIAWGCLSERCSGYPWVVTVNNQSNDGVLVQPIVYQAPDDTAASSMRKLVLGELQRRMDERERNPR